MRRAPVAGELNVMKLFNRSGLIAGVVVAAGLTACSKPEQAAAPVAVPVAAPAAAEPAPALEVAEAMPAPAPAITPAPVVVEIKQPVVEIAKPAGVPAPKAEPFSLANFKLPDFQSASTLQLASTATQVLTGLGELAGPSSPSAMTQIEAVKTSLSAGKALEAISALSKLGDTVKAIPGAEGLLTVGKQVVSAWALKQGFDPAKISGSLGALQKGDWVGLAAQVATLVGKGGVTGEQKGLLDGVLGLFGQNSGAASAATSALKGLLGK